jgi:hypothetical protein
MKRLYVFFSVLAFALLPLCASAATRITIPGGTAVPIRLVDSIDSGSANVGDTFEFKADDNVVVNGYVVVARGAEGRGTVSSVERAGGHGHAGNLGLKFDYVYAVDGEKIRLEGVKKNKNGEGNAGASSTATIAGTLLLGPIGLFAHNWVKGKNVTVDSSKVFTVFVSDTVHVVSNQRATASDNGFAH